MRDTITKHEITYPVLRNSPERTAFDVYFAGIVAMAHCHPGAGQIAKDRTTSAQLTIEQCADIAVEMVRERRKRFSETETVIEDV